MQKSTLIETKGVVAFLDALGTKGIWAREDPNKYYRSWVKVLDSFDYCIDQIKPKKIKGIKDYSFNAFSDTIIITLECDNPNEYIPLMSKILVYPFFIALCQGVFIKGVINTGKYFRSNTIIFGPAIDKAAELYTYTDWIGISTTKNASLGVDLFVNQGNDVSDTLVKYDTPIKNNRTMNVWALAWPVKSSKGVIDRKRMLFDFVLRIFSGIQLDAALSVKYDNTLIFLEFVCQKYGL